MKRNVILEKSMDFAVRIVKLYQYLSREKGEEVMAQQMLRSGTSVGANVHEAVEGASKKDFIAKMGISLKEASETRYWLELLYRTEYLTEVEYESIRQDCDEVTRLLVAIVKTSRGSVTP